MPSLADLARIVTRDWPHHIMFRVSSEQQQLAWRAQLANVPLAPEPMMAEPAVATPTPKELEALQKELLMLKSVIAQVVTRQDTMASGRPTILLQASMSL